MKEHVSFLIHQLARFGALTIPQMKTMGEGRFHKSTLYRNLNQLMEMDLIAKAMHPRKHLFAYTATQDAYRLVYGKNAGGTPLLRIGDLAHTLLVAETLISAARLSNISGIAVERELDETTVKDFCYSRIPDGIIQVSREDHSYELAVEVETSIKTESKIEKVLESYEKTFLREMPCSGVLIVAVNPYSFSKYRELVEKKSEAFQKRARLVHRPDLTELDPKVYGTPWKNMRLEVGKTLEKLRTHSNQYVPIKPILSIDNALTQASIRDIYKDPVKDLGPKEILS